MSQWKSRSLIRTVFYPIANISSS